MNSKKSFLVVCLVLMVSLSGFTVDNVGFSFAASVGEFGSDLNTGGTIRTPLILGSIFAELSGYAAWHSGIPISGNASWPLYGMLRVGLGGATTLENLPLRLYGVGGLLCVFPSAVFSSESYALGAYGVMGFEVFTFRGSQGNAFAYYAELGTNGISAVADKDLGNPLWLNGFSETVGIRYYF